MANNKKKTQFRSAEFQMDSLSKEERTVNLSFSSEAAYERYSHKWGGNYYEVLGHNPEEIDLSFIGSGHAPLLKDHDTTEQIGVVLDVQLSEFRAVASVLLSQNEEGTNELRDISEGIRSNISVGYNIIEEEKVGEKDGIPVVRVTRWKPVEISTVSIPADESVGVGRSDNNKESVEIKPHNKNLEVTQMDTKDKVEVNVEEIKREAAKSEQARVREISALGNKFNMGKTADEFVRNDKSAEDFRAYVLENMDTTAKATEVKAEKSSLIGLSDKEVQNFSFMRAIRAQIDPRYAKEAGFEIECSRAAAEKQGVEARGIMVPHDILIRALTSGGSANGANFVSTDLLAGSFIDLLRNRMVTQQAGATLLTGLRGNLAIPAQNAASQAYWVAEGVAPTTSVPQMTQVTLSPKTLGTYVDYTRQFALQSSLSVEQFVRNDLAKVLAIEIDRAALYGNTALGEPKGVVFQTGVDSSVAFATGATPTFANVVSMETAVETDNALLGSLSYISAVNCKGNMKVTPVAANTSKFVFEDNMVNGYPCLASNQVTAGDLFFGNWADLLIGMWGGLDLVVDTAALATSGGFRIIALQSVDTAVRHGQSFAFAQ